MARQDSLSIFINDKERDKLAETYGDVIESIQVAALSEQIKNKNYSGDPTTGSVEIDRFKNSEVAEYGTARSAGEGKNVKNTGKVTIKVDTDKEIVEEIEKKDIRLHGASGMAERRKGNHVQRVSAYLDREFFNEAEKAGKKITLNSETLEGKLEELIQDVETTVNDWVDGVDRELLVLTVSPRLWGKISNYIDKTINTITNATEYRFHRVKIYPNHRQTADAICMIDGAVAQLVSADVYDVERIPLSNAIALTFFFSKGTKAVMPDLIKYATVSVGSGADAVDV
jgi:hypothetical protein